MQTRIVTVEETHFTGQNAIDYPFNVWLDGRWVPLITGDFTVELGECWPVKYDPQDQFATVIPAKLNLAERIYQELQSQRFFEWYGDNGDCGMHIRGDFRPGTAIIPSKEDLMKYIKKHFLGE